MDLENGLVRIVTLKKTSTVYDNNDPPGTPYVHIYVYYKSVHLYARVQQSCAV